MALGRDFVQDVRFGVRPLSRRPGFTLTATLVLGLGAPTIVFTLVNRIFLERPAGVTEPDRLIRVWRSWASGQGGGSLGNPDYLYSRDNASTLAGLAAYDARGVAAAYSIGSDQVSRLRAGFVSANHFDILGVVPARGRAFLPEDNTTPGTRPVPANRAARVDPVEAIRTKQGYLEVHVEDSMTRRRTLTVATSVLALSGLAQPRRLR